MALPSPDRLAAVGRQATIASWRTCCSRGRGSCGRTVGRGGSRCPAVHPTTSTLSHSPSCSYRRWAAQAAAAIGHIVVEGVSSSKQQWLPGRSAITWYGSRTTSWTRGSVIRAAIAVLSSAVPAAAQSETRLDGPQRQLLGVAQGCVVGLRRGDAVRGSDPGQSGGTTTRPVFQRGPGAFLSPRGPGGGCARCRRGMVAPSRPGKVDPSASTGALQINQRPWGTPAKDLTVGKPDLGAHVARGGVRAPRSPEAGSSAGSTWCSTRCEIA